MNTIGELAYQNILGIRFFTGSAEAAVQLGLEGGLVVVPAAPLLVELATNLGVREAVFSADLAITDSAFMVLLWQLLTGERIPRISGLRYLRLLLATKEFRSSETVFWVMPSAAARDQNLAWLRSQGHDFTEKDCHVAPRYAAGPIVDELLVAQVKSRKPKHIVICLGGGTQERLGFMLRRECDFRPGIHCIGAETVAKCADDVRVQVVGVIPVALNTG